MYATVEGRSFFFLFFFYPCCSNSMKIKDMLWIENIVKSTLAPSFLTNFRIDMDWFCDPHKVVTRRNGFLAFPHA